MESNAGLRLLCLDGGGVRGLSELIILQAVMTRVQDILQLAETPRPSDYFEMIGGTSTGGLIAIMLGRLNMTVDEAIDAYGKLSRTIFGTKRSRFQTDKYSEKTFESVIKAVVASKLGDENAKMLEKEEPRCKSFVCTVSARSIPHTRLFRSYRVKGINEYDCTIWEAARGTCAAPTYFESVLIGPEGRQEEFFDGGLGSNNPIKELHREAELMFDADEEVSCVLSLGTGARNPTEVKRPGRFGKVSYSLDLVDAFKKMALSSERYAQDMDRKYADIEGVYFRLNVERGLQSVKLADWDELGAVKTHTHAFLESQGVPKNIELIAKALIGQVASTGNQPYTLALLSMSNQKVIDAVRRSTTASSRDLGRFYKSGSSLNTSQEDLVRTWLLKNDADKPRAENDQSIYLSKRFHDPDTQYKSGQWIFDSAQWMKFIEKNNRSVLWLQGPPGSGKSVLTAGVVVKLQEKALDGDAHVLYHYCHRDPQPTTSLDVVKSLLLQALTMASSSNLSSLFNLSVEWPNSNISNSQIEEAMWQSLRDILHNETVNKVFLIIDGVDEIRSNASPLSRIISFMKDSKDRQQSLMLSSRFDCDIKDAIEDLDTVEYLQLEITENIVRKDMEEFVAFQVNNKKSPLRRKPQQIRNDITYKICERAQSSFLYASLVLDELKGEKIASPAAITRTLGTLPTGLIDIYKHHLELPLSTDMGKEVFQWVSCTIRPLKWPELKSALALIDGKVSEDYIINDTLEVFLQYSCGQLIEAFGDSRDSLRFIHPTVKEILLMDDGPGMDLDVRDAHSIVATKLLTFLQSQELPAFSLELSLDENQNLVTEFMEQPENGLYPYAVLHWFSHVAKCEQDACLEIEDLLCDFLSSSSCVDWLKAALVMSGWSADSRDTAALTADVVESLESWIQTRISDGEVGSTSFIRSWIDDFVGLMQDWSQALEARPFWIHFIPQQFLRDGSQFRQSTAALRASQKILQFEDRPVITARTIPDFWQRLCFSIDVSRSLAYTWNPATATVSCYHTRTGISAAEVQLKIGSRDISNFELVSGIQSPQNRYLALLFRDRSYVKQDDTLCKHLRAGLQPTTFADFEKPVWVLQNADCIIELVLVPITMGITTMHSFVCIFELNHDGLMRKNLFGHPKWWLEPTCAGSEQWFRWEVDDINTLAFSADSSMLATPAGILSMETGKVLDSRSYGLDIRIGGVHLSQDFGTLAIVKDCNTLEFITSYGPSKTEIGYSHTFPGAIHILTISSKGRYVLLLRLQQHYTGDAPEPKLQYVQDGFLGVFDRKKKCWTPLLQIIPPASRKLNAMDFAHQHWFAQFGPESTKVFEPDTVVFQCPTKWNICENVRGKSHSPLTNMQLVVFQSEDLIDGFGDHPSFQFAAEFQKMPSSIPLALYTEFMLGLWQPNQETDEMIVTRDIFKVTDLNTRKSIADSISPARANSGISVRQGLELKPSTSSSTEIPSSSVEYDTLFQASTIKTSVLLRNKRNMELFWIEFSAKSAYNAEGTRLRNIPSSISEQQHNVVQMNIKCMQLSAEEKKIFQKSLKVYNNGGLNSMQFRNVAINGGEAIFDTTTLCDLSTTSNIDQVNVSDLFLEKLFASFRSHCRPFATSDSSPVNNKLSRRQYTLFDPVDVQTKHLHRHVVNTQDRLIESGGRLFLASNVMRVRDNMCLVQFSRLIEKAFTEPDQGEADEHEVYLCIFDIESGDMRWFTHTTTGGYIRNSAVVHPKALWALHPTQPLLFWTLPGHSIRVSHIASGLAPLNVADSITLATEASEAIQFSPNGRFVSLRSRSTFKHDLLHIPSAEKVESVLVIMDLVLGERILLRLSPSAILSYDLQDESLNIYQLTKTGAVQVDVFFLPDLDTFDRRILAFLPNRCCCPTCGRLYSDCCYIWVAEKQGLKSIVISHSPLPVGYTSIGNYSCEPLVVRVTNPKMPVKSMATKDSLIVERRVAKFPPIMEMSGNCLLKPFGDHEELSLQDVLKKGGAQLLNDVQRSEILQVQKRHSKYSEEHDQGGALPYSWEILQADYEHSTHNLAFEDSFAKKVRDDEVLAKLNAHYGGFIPATWDEMQEQLKQLEDMDDPIMKNWTKTLFRDTGIGCNIPLYLHTFYLPDATGDEAVTKMSWSSAVDIGWLEESAEWFSKRVWRNSFQGARKWYNFEQYGDLDFLKWDPAARLEEKRKLGSAKERLSALDSGRLGLELPEKVEGSAESEEDSTVKEMLSTFASMGMFMNDLDHLLPGSGSIFKSRMHQFLNQSLLQEVE